MKTILIGSILALVLLSTTATAQLDCNDDSTICDTNAMCIESDGSFDCECNSGYAGDGTACMDVNECDTDGDNCHEDATCTNTDGTFTCACNSGYMGDGADCTDVNECTDGSNNCHVYATCTNTPGNFTCACNSGFTGNGTTCMDIDECVSSPCSDYADCYNLPGGYSCTCLEGFTGNGTTCTSLCSPECGMNTKCDDSGDDNDYDCECLDGYEGNPIAGCTDINECETGENCQDDYAISCNNTDGGYFCTCQDGYFYYSQFVEKCIKIGDLPVRVPAKEVPGCYEEANYYYRIILRIKTELFIDEYLQAVENYGNGGDGNDKK